MITVGFSLYIANIEKSSNIEKAIFPTFKDFVEVLSTTALIALFKKVIKAELSQIIRPMSCYFKKHGTF